jgi:acetyl-CoA hydrolase
VPKKVALESLDFTSLVLAGDFVCWGQAAGEPLSLTQRLLAQRNRIGNFSAFIGISIGDTVDPVYADKVSFTSFCGTGNNRKLSVSGALDIMPVHYTDLPGVLSDKVDVLLLQLAEHPVDGRLSLSCSCDYVATLVKTARVVVAEVNRQAPFTSAVIEADDIDLIVQTDRPIPELARGETSAIERAIAAHVATLIGDGATIQLGLGALPECIAELLTDRRDLGLHSGLIGDSAVRLIKSGAVTNAHKPVDAGQSVTGTLLGSRALLDFVHLNDSIAMRPIAQTHGLSVIATLPRFTAINAAIEVDLSGQANTETAGGRYVGAIGGALDFLRGARASVGGVPILALPSVLDGKSGRRSRIVTQLNGPATIGRADAAIVVTEHGVADLRKLSLTERAVALAAIADPEFRDELLAAANKQ